MASNTIGLYSSKAWGGSIYWESTPNVAGNYSNVYVCATMWKEDGYLTSSNSPTSGTITINGSSYSLIGIKEFKDSVCIFEDTIRVYHNNDGSKSITISLTCYGQSGTSLSGYTLSGSGTAVLDNIPRSSTLSCNGGSLGSALTLNITSQSDSFTHTITYKCGSASGTVCTKTSLKSVEWSPPLSLAAQSTTSDTVSITFTLTAYSGSTAIGTSTIAVKCSIPSSVAPSISVDISDAKGYFSKYGAYVQSKSALSVKITANGIYGSTISGYQVVFDEKTYSGSRITTNEIKGYGTLSLVATVTDSRGISASKSINISVLSYNSPSISNLVAQRCDADGTRSASGAYLAVVFDATVTALGNKNSAAYTLKYKKGADTVYTSVSLTDLDGKYFVSGYQYIFAASKNSGYNIVISVKDDFPAVEKSAVGPSEMTLWSKFAKGMGFAFGKVAERIGYLDMGFHIHMNGNRLHGLPAPVDSDDAVTKSYADIAAYPVGSVYISVSAVSPAQLFGGVWEQIKGRFLLATGYPDENSDNDSFGEMSGYYWSAEPGSTGGQDFHQITLDEMPEHYHDLYIDPADTRMEVGSSNYWPLTYNGGNTNGAIVAPEGNDEPHNNMPPYLAVYMWKRVE